MVKRLANQGSEAQKLRERVTELERTLAEARKALRELPSSESDLASEPVTEQNDSLSQALYNAPYPLMIRGEDGSIVMVNAAWTEVTGYTLEDIPPLKEWVQEAYGANAEQREAIIAKEVFSHMGIKKWGEFEIRTRSGQTRILDFSTAPMRVDENSRELMMVMAVDVTSHKQAEQAVRDSEERFSKTFRKAPFGMNITRWSDGVILDVNDAWLDMLGWTREEVLGKTTADFPFYANPKERLIVRQRIMNNESLSDIELELIRKDGTRRTALVATTIIEVAGERCILGVLDDITNRKHAEDALRESEHRYRELFEIMQEGLIVGEVITDDRFNPVDYRYLEVNPATERQFGIARAQFIGRTYTEVLPEQDHAWIEILGRVALSGEPANVEHYSRASQRWFEAHAYSPRAGQFVSILTDITERKKAEDALRQSEQRFSKAFHSSPNAIIISRLSDGLIIEVNDGWSAIFRHQASEVIGRTSIELGVFAHPEDREKAIALLQEHGSLRDFELQIRTKTGDIREASMSVELLELNDTLCLLTVMQDITERKQAEQSLRESAQRFHSLADSMPQLAWTALPDGSVDYYNKRYLEYRDIQQRQGSTWEWTPVLHPDDADATIHAWQHSVSTGEVYQIEHRVRMANGSYRWHLSRGIPVFDEHGHVIRWFGTATDIHEQKMAEEKLKTYTERLERSNRELEQFAFMASHDLQEPLRKIQVFGDLLAVRAETLNDRELEYVKRMRSAAGRMREMVSGLLQLSRVNTQGSPFTTVDLAQAIAGAISDHVEQIEKTSGVVEVAPLPTVIGDALQLRQLMQNLIGNALKYHRPEMYPRVRIYAEQSADAVKLFVQDNGIGFEQENAERIFQPFQRLVGRSQFEGSGMGLAICRKIVERHGGEIRAQSTPGVGTTFIVTLPKALSPSSEKDNHEYKATDLDR